MAYKIGIVGATGAVGQDLIELLYTRAFPVAELVLLASARSVDKTIRYQDRSWTVREARPEAFADLDLVFFSAGAGTSKELCPAAVAAGATVVDNSSAFRMDPSVPLIVPEVNPHAARDHKGILANPNCSTAIALMGLTPLHRCFGLQRFIACTYQAVSGSGVKGMVELENQVRAWTDGSDCPPVNYPHPIAFNLFPHVDSFQDNGYTKEELKMLNEGRKIMELPELQVSTTCVRVPVMRAHSIALHAEFTHPVDLATARQAIRDFPGVQLLDDPANALYPTPLALAGTWDCAVGRLRKDTVFANGLALWVVGDQILKGAALNAVQIAELLHKEALL